jgi:hypothetical protein
LPGRGYGHKSAYHETRPWVGARNPVSVRWAPKGRGEPVAQPATRGVHVTSVAGFVLGKGLDAAEEERWRRG